jgi:hypothetical protein
MATIGTASHSSYLNTPRRSYITTTAFQNDIFQYTTTTNPTTFVVTGTLTSLATVGTGTSANCPANRILVENGKKLYPSGLYQANNTTYGAPNPGVTTYMVGVYDPASFLSGFIDPNSKVFAPYNTDKPDYVPRGINPNGNTEVDQGPPVYTLGSVTAGTTVSAGTTISAGTGITTTSGQIRSSTVTALATTAPATLNASLSQVFSYTPTQSATINATNVSAGSVVYIVITTSGTSSYTITFGTNFKATGTLATGVADGKVFTVTFVSDGTNLNEVSRTTAM